MPSKSEGHSPDGFARNKHCPRNIDVYNVLDHYRIGISKFAGIPYDSGIVYEAVQPTERAVDGFEESLDVFRFCQVDLNGKRPAAGFSYLAGNFLSGRQILEMSNRNIETSCRGHPGDSRSNATAAAGNDENGTHLKCTSSISHFRRQSAN